MGRRMARSLAADSGWPGSTLRHTTAATHWASNETTRLNHWILNPSGHTVLCVPRARDSQCVWVQEAFQSNTTFSGLPDRPLRNRVPEALSLAILPIARSSPQSPIQAALATDTLDLRHDCPTGVMTSSPSLLVNGSSSRDSFTVRNSDPHSAGESAAFRQATKRDSRLTAGSQRYQNGPAVTDGEIAAGPAGSALLPTASADFVANHQCLRWRSKHPTAARP